MESMVKAFQWGATPAEGGRMDQLRFSAEAIKYSQDVQKPVKKDLRMPSTYMNRNIDTQGAG